MSHIAIVYICLAVYLFLCTLVMLHEVRRSRKKEQDEQRHRKFDSR